MIREWAWCGMWMRGIRKRFNSQKDQCKNSHDLAGNSSNLLGIQTKTRRNQGGHYVRILERQETLAQW